MQKLLLSATHLKCMAAAAVARYVNIPAHISEKLPLFFGYKICIETDTVPRARVVMSRFDGREKAYSSTLIDIQQQ